MSHTVNLQHQSAVREEMMDIIIDSIQDIKGKHILQLDLRELHDAPTDFFIICEGDSITQVRAIADRISFRLKNELDELPNHVEGTRESRWICLDYFDVVVHVFHPEARAFYELEELWSDAKVKEYEDQ